MSKSRKRIAESEDDDEEDLWGEEEEETAKKPKKRNKQSFMSAAPTTVPTQPHTSRPPSDCMSHVTGPYVVIVVC